MTAHSDLVSTLATVAAHHADADDRLVLPGWSAETWAVALAEADVVDLPNGAPLVARAEPGSDLFFLVEGLLEVSVPKSASVTMVPFVPIAPGSVVGEVAFLDAQARSASVRASGHARLFRLPKPAFERLRRNRPDLAADLLHAIARTLALRLRRALHRQD